jgi:hypothetical protein
VSSEPERPAELSDVQGAWRRDGRRVGDEPWGEVSDVLWLQVGTRFCDLRASRPGPSSDHLLDRPQAFSGTVEISRGAITFHHDLDSLPRDPAHPDVSTVHLAAAAMYERGPGFEERWVRTSGPDDGGGVAELRADGAAPLARVVRVGPLALAVWGGRTPGGARYRADHEWVPERPASCDRSISDVDEAVLALAFGVPLPPRWRTVATAPR